MRTVWRTTDRDLDRDLDRHRIAPRSTALRAPEMPDADVNDNTEKLLERMPKTMTERERPRPAVVGVEGPRAQGQGCVQGSGPERSLRKEPERTRLVEGPVMAPAEGTERPAGGVEQTRLHGSRHGLGQGLSQDPSQRQSQGLSQSQSQRQSDGQSQDPSQRQSQGQSQDSSQRQSHGQSQDPSQRQSQDPSQRQSQGQSQDSSQRQSHGQSEVASQSHGRSRSRSRPGVQGASCTVELDRSRNAVIVLSSWPRQEDQRDQQGNRRDQQENRQEQQEQQERTAGTGAGDMELERLSSEPGMVVEPHQGYGSFPSPSSNVNGRPGTSGRTDIMEESDTYLQSRPLLHDEADWRTAPHGDGDRDGQDQVANGGFGYQTAANGAAKADDSVRVNIGVPTSPRFPKEKLKTLLAMLWMVFNFILTLTSLAITHERVPETPPLPDIVLDSVPTGAWALQVSEITIMVLVNSAFLVVVLHRHRFIVFRRIFLIMGLLYMMRSILYFVTALPKPDENYKCEPKAGYLSFALVASRVLKLFGGFGLSINGQHVYCGDYIYSGHTVTLTMAYLVLREYTPRHWWPLHGAALLAATTGIVMVLVARGHYTVDVLIAYYVTTRLFWMYHTLANNSTLKEGGANNYLSRIWWFPMFRYFERNVSGPVPRRFEWPLPWPRCLLSKRPDRTS